MSSYSTTAKWLSRRGRRSAVEQSTHVAVSRIFKLQDCILEVGLRSRVSQESAVAIHQTQTD